MSDAAAHELHAGHLLALDYLLQPDSFPAMKIRQRDSVRAVARPLRTGEAARVRQNVELPCYLSNEDEGLVIWE